MVTHAPVTHDGLVGTLHTPGKLPAPGVICLSGSEGGQSFRTAKALAEQGFTALSLAYVKSKFTPRPEEANLPDPVLNVPLEYCARALQWLAAQPSVIGDRVAVHGQSRGAELGLQLGSMFRVVSNVIAVAPSAVRWGASWTAEDRPAWLYLGEPLPYSVDYSGTPAENAHIAVERIQGPVLLISGGDDQMWPSEKFAKQIMQRLDRYGHTGRYQDTHLHYASAGHFAGGPPFTPSSELGAMAGGSAEGNSAAQTHSWRTMLSFLGQHTTSGPEPPAKTL